MVLDDRVFLANQISQFLVDLLWIWDLAVKLVIWVWINVVECLRLQKIQGMLAEI